MCAYAPTIRPLTFYEWLLFLHVAGAFALVAALVAYWALVLATGRTEPANERDLMNALGRPAAVLVTAGLALTLVFGVWLAIYVDGYELWDFWILAALALWGVGTETGRRAGNLLTSASAAASGDERTGLRRRGVLLHAASSTAVLLVLILMIFKPGA